ncbi:uncharacterized protein LOC132749010 [Ruditapes philippinarum]|uniref:uncharacterized protein LOC132749010 n=1 Tax=Ruditapes philippinarum TaxID=129788 RepID=UPI00295A77B6|nr:uncharacterized protein LOC132749010 [Ruditapes philippinarum]
MNTKQMKDLRLDVELVNTSGVDVPTSDITTNTENISEMKSYDEVLDENVAKETNDVEGKNAGTTKEISNGFERKYSKNVNGIENAGYLNDPDAMNGRTIKEIDLNESAKVGNGRYDGNIGAVTRNEPAIITSDKSDATKKRKRDYKANLWKTVFLLWNITNLGWDYGQIGPIFPDLQDIAGVSLSQGSWFFTSFAVGYCFGCLISGFIQSKVNSHIMLFLYTMLSAGSMTLLPWIPTFEVMTLLRALHGFGIGGQDTCVHSMLFGLWGHKVGPYFQMLHVLYAVGGVVSPLITKPFLREGKYYLFCLYYKLHIKILTRLNGPVKPAVVIYNPRHKNGVPRFLS